EALREKSERLTGYLQFLLDRMPAGRFELLTPRTAAQRGCQVSLRIAGSAPELFKRLRRAGVVVDFRQPDVIRVAPVPLYNSFQEVCRFARILEDAGAGEPAPAKGR
ncbi:MAG: kynureninase, partial [Acidobacteriota bacterium]